MLYSKGEMFWWMGVVENRRDPLQLGRCKVRIFGYHTEDISTLPTDDLPWATVLQPITSAAISGKGTSPIGPLEGTWVVGIFLDGDEKQQPLVLGTIAGKPKGDIYTAIPKASEIVSGNYVKDSSGNPVYDSSGNPILTGTSETTDNVITKLLPPLDVTLTKKLIEAIGKRESNGNYTAENQFGYLGKYQFGAAALIDLGYVKEGTTNANLGDSNRWTGKDGIPSKTAFLNSNTIQESSMFSLLDINYKRLLKRGVITTNDSTEKVAGFLAASHLVGSGNADKFDKKDGNGVKASTYFTLGSYAVGGDGSVPSQGSEIPNRETYLPDNPNNIVNNPTKPLNHPSLASKKGFRDPNRVYPTREYINIGDVNKLAIGDDSHESILKKLNNRTTKIPLGNSSNTWDEPTPAYSARYPYNYVHETESGHVIELDNTPGRERIHVFHKSGSYIEIDVNGSLVKKTIGDEFEISERNKYVYIKGGYNLTVDGATKILVRDRCDIQVEGDTNLISNGNMNITAAKNVGISAKNAIVTGKESVNIISDGDVNIQGKNIFMKAKGNMNLDATGTFSALGRISALLHGAIVKIKMGAESLSSLGIVLPTPEAKSPDSTSLSDLKRPPTGGIGADGTFLFDGGENEAKNHAESRKEAGETNDNALAEGTREENINLPNNNPNNCDCEEFKNFTVFPDTIKLSNYFTLGALTTRTAVSSYELKDFNGLTKAQIACNLKYLAVNTLDKIKLKYSDMIIASCFRTKDTSSDHGKGFAADLQFTSHAFTDYFEISKWIRDNVPFSQILLEYETRNSGTIAWIHVSLYKDAKKHGLPTATFKNHSVYARNSFIDLSSTSA